jgi:hypothetical protein
MHGAAEEVDAGRLVEVQAAGVLTATILTALAAPNRPRQTRPCPPRTDPQPS